MLRIHTDKEAEAISIRLEGKLIHPWVDELVQVWMEHAHRNRNGCEIRVDLSEVSYVDARGKALLVTMHRMGATLQGSGPFITAVIDEIYSL
jgi:ABC-type transporter Mla MlaB component